MIMSDKYICNECGEGVHCELKVEVGEPLFCPISGDDMNCGEWCKRKPESEAENVR